jgi:glycosyltransferase involved in cell wall biosynthesis
MKIGICLRAWGERGGIGIYTKNLVKTLINIDRRNKYVLFYKDQAYVGQFKEYTHVTEVFVPIKNTFLWDHLAIPYYAGKFGIDVLFHTKFTVPLFTMRKTVMTIHGPAWFTHPQLFKPMHVLYARIFMPLYCRKAAAVLSNSELTKRDYVKYLGVKADNIRTVHLAQDDCFRPINDRSELAGIKKKYDLPDEFMLSVIKHDPRKNFINLIQAFRIAHERIKCTLVVVGIGCKKYRDEYPLKEWGLDNDVVFLDWVEQKELPVFYNLAKFLFFPSVYEAFGIPVCEAMACGCPVVVANTGALPEISGDAGILVDPNDPEKMADALCELWNNNERREHYAKKALLRSKDFSREKCARETLTVFESMGK